MNILIYIGHPAQYYFFKYIIRDLKEHGNKISIVIKSKDFLETLLKENSEEFWNILPEGRKNSRVQVLWGLIKRDVRLLRIVNNKKYDLFLGSDPSIAHIGWLLRIPVLTVLEDDIEVIQSLAKLTYPFTSYIVTPKNVRVGRYKRKQITYDGFMKLAYLHPSYFTPQINIHNMPVFLIRLSALSAYHDKGINGIDDNLLDKIIDSLENRVTIYISSEKEVPHKYLKFQIKVKVSDMHQFLSQVDLLISDSQSMSVEAAMLGVPSIRFSDFAGRISVLEELEHKYHLTFGIPASQPEKLLKKIEEIINNPSVKTIFKQRQAEMLSEKIDVTAFMTWLIVNFPSSIKILKKTPDYQNNFR